MIGPTASKPGPTLPNVAATALAEVTKPKSSIDNSKVPPKKSIKYNATKLNMLDILSGAIGELLILIATIALGCSFWNSSLLINFITTKTLTTFIAPAVDAEHPPTNIRKNNTILLKVGHRSKLAEANPVVVIIDELWKNE